MTLLLASIFHNGSASSLGKRNPIAGEVRCRHAELFLISETNLSVQRAFRKSLYGRTLGMAPKIHPLLSEFGIVESRSNIGDNSPPFSSILVWYHVRNQS